MEVNVLTEKNFIENFELWKCIMKLYYKYKIGNNKAYGNYTIL